MSARFECGHWAELLSSRPYGSSIYPEDDLREWARILGPQFRGAIVVTGMQNGKLVAQQAELTDLARARTVFNLGELK